MKDTRKYFKVFLSGISGFLFLAVNSSSLAGDGRTPEFSVDLKRKIPEITEIQDYDVIGLRLGQTPDDVIKILEKDGYEIKLKNERYYNFSIMNGSYSGHYNFEDQKWISAIVGIKNDGLSDRITVFFTSKNLENKSYCVNRSIVHRDSSKRFDAEGFFSAVKEKFDLSAADMYSSAEPSLFVKAKPSDIKKNNAAIFVDCGNGEPNDLLTEAGASNWVSAFMIPSDTPIIDTTIFSYDLLRIDGEIAGELQKKFSDRYENRDERPAVPTPKI